MSGLAGWLVGLLRSSVCRWVRASVPRLRRRDHDATGDVAAVCPRRKREGEDLRQSETTSGRMEDSEWRREREGNKSAIAFFLDLWERALTKYRILEPNKD